MKNPVQNREFNAQIVAKLEAAASVILQASPAAAECIKRPSCQLQAACTIAERVYTFSQLADFRKDASGGFDRLIYETPRKQRMKPVPSPRLKPEICQAIEAAAIEGISLIDGKVFVSLGCFSCWAGSNIFEQIRALKAQT